MFSTRRTHQPLDVRLMEAPAHLTIGESRGRGGFGLSPATGQNRDQCRHVTLAMT